MARLFQSNARTKALRRRFIVSGGYFVTKRCVLAFYTYENVSGSASNELVRDIKRYAAGLHGVSKTDGIQFQTSGVLNWEQE